MTGTDRRLSSLSSALTAKERALLVLRSWKEDKDEDPAWRRTMPPDQAREFSYYIDLMNGINRNLVPLVMQLEANVEMLSLRSGWLSTFLLWQVNVDRITEFIEWETTELVTETEYAELERKAREEYKPLDELVVLLVERHEGWTDADLAPEQPDDPHDGVIVMPQAWERVEGEKRAEIAALVKDGTLEGQGRGKSLQVGSFYDWLGEKPPVKPGWAKTYDVRPDDQADAVGMHRYGRERAWEAYRRGPTAPIPFMDGLEVDTGEPSRVDEIVEAHKERMKAGVEEQWPSLLALEQVVSEVAVKFDGEDPALPVLRDVLDSSREKLEGLKAETERYTGPFELPEPGEAEVAFVRDLAERRPP